MSNCLPLVRVLNVESKASTASEDVIISDFFSPFIFPSPNGIRLDRLLFICQRAMEIFPKFYFRFSLALSDVSYLSISFRINFEN